MHVDVLIAERREPGARRIGERAVALDAHHLAREPRQHRGLIARAGADFEHAVLRPHAELLGHVGDHVGLADGLAAGDRQRPVGIGVVREAVVDEVLARHLVERAQHRHVVDAAPAQLEQELHAADAVFLVRLLATPALFRLLLCAGVPSWPALSVSEMPTPTRNVPGR